MPHGVTFGRPTAPEGLRGLESCTNASTRALEQDIRTFLADHNESPRPFRWTKTADQILASLKRYCTKANAVRVEQARRAKLN